MPNTFSAKFDNKGRELLDGVYLMETAWDADMQISSDLVEDSPYITRHDIPESRPVLEFRVTNAMATYEITNYDDVSQIYTCKLLSGDVF